MKRLALILLTCILSLNLAAQQTTAQERDKTTPYARPNVKGDLFVDFGFNVLNNRVKEMDTRLFASRVANVYYQFPIELGNNSGITFNPGIGLGMDKLGFKRDSTLVNNPDLGPSSSQMKGIRTLYGEEIDISVNTTAINYVDIPLEFRYHLNKNDYNKGFRFAIGGKVGFLYNAHTKIEYTDSNGLSQKIKTKQDYGLSPLRYGVYTRIGLPGFNLWSYYGLNNVFKEGQGPFGTEANQFNFGISVALF
jgi:hypothetical protein